MPDFARQAQDAIDSRDVTAARNLFFKNHWDAPPEPDWLPESRVRRMISAELSEALIKLIITEPRQLNRTQEEELVAEVHYLELPDLYNEVSAAIPNADPHLDKARQLERYRREELQAAEEGRSIVEPLDLGEEFMEPDDDEPDDDDFHGPGQSYIPDHVRLSNGF